MSETDFQFPDDDVVERGRALALLLVEHMEGAGAGKITTPITTDDGCYIVEVRKTL